MTRIKTIVMLAAVVLICAPTLWAQNLPSYYSRTRFLMGGATSYEKGLLGLANPANAGMSRSFNGSFAWRANNGDGPDISDWALFTGGQGMGFSMLQTKSAGFRVRDYNLSLGGGDPSGGFGIAYNWSGGDEAAFGRKNFWSVGFISRPLPYLSVGVTGNFASGSKAREGVAEVGVRPFGNPRLTLFADMAIQRKERLDEAPWSVGAAAEVLPGLHITGRYFESEAFTLGLQLSLGKGRLSGQSHFDSDQERSYDTYSVGFGDFRRSFMNDVFPQKGKYVSTNLKGTVDYRTYRFFDDNKNRFFDLLVEIRRAVKDPDVSVLAYNLSGLRVYPEHAWEIREELRKAREAGKKVIVYIDNAGMTGYHLASVADVVVMDPEGMLEMPGYLLGRTYLKGTLDKMGLAFDEWRFFKYKSAAEALSRESMSDGDREQRQALADDWYELLRREVGVSRQLSDEQFDRIINEQVMLMADDALEAGLVDTLARFHDLEDLVKHYFGPSGGKMSKTVLAERANSGDYWGSAPQIALVYALGECAMDSGIKARSLSRQLRGLAKNKSVKAVVMRVDSPGGDPLASDLVAEAIQEIAGEKPVIISQGQVAGSGGYWISMYGDKILAGPGTITGSVGVIGGWIYDKGFSGKLGMTADYVKVGDHADLGFGVRLPLLGIQVPARPMSEQERARAEQWIRELYDRFLVKVASGRNMSKEAVGEIAQGRIYSGVDGKANGLVDELGGMIPAIEMAREMAGLGGKRYTVREMGRYSGLFAKDALVPIGIESKIAADPVLNFVKTMTENPGKPLPMLIPGDYPVEPAK